MDDCATVTCKDHCIGRGHGGTLQQLLLGQVRQGLIAGGANAGKGNAAPRPVHGCMDMAKMDIRDAVAIGAQKLCQRCAVFGDKSDLVFGRQSKRHGIVMHEQARAGAVFQLTFKPIAPRGAEVASVGARSGCVEVDQTRAVHCFCVVDETGWVFGMVRKSAKKRGAVIVVANQQAHRARHIGQRIDKGRIGRRLAPMGQIAGDDNPRGVAVLRAHIVKRLGKTSVGVQPPMRSPGDCQVNVGNVHKFHGPEPFLERSRPPPKGRPELV